MIKRLNKIKEINWSSGDSCIKAIVVDWNVHYTGDIQSVLSYRMNSEEKI